jgi:hypothetical protein
MKIALIALATLTVAVAANAQSYGTISGPDYFGGRTIRYNNGISGTLSGPDYFGGRTLRYNDGSSYNISGPDYFGGRTIRQQTMPYYGNSFFNR